MKTSSVLAVETAQLNCTVALSTREGIHQLVEPRARMHSQRLLPMLDELLHQGHCSLSQLEAIALTVGPGSFTGLRVGASAVQALAYVYQIPVFSVSNLALLAFSGWQKQLTKAQLRADDQKCVAIIDGRINGLYWALFEYTNQGFVRVSADALSPAPQDEISALFESVPQLHVFTDKETLNGANIQPLLEDIAPSYTVLTPDAGDVIEYINAHPPTAIEALALELDYLGGAGAWKKISDQ